jgi:Bacterial Ig domain
LLAEVSDESRVAGVQFQLDGAQLGAEDTAAPYEMLWNAADSEDGVHTVTAVARDAAGRETMTSIVVTVANEILGP